MRLSEYPAEERQEWLDLPATHGFIEELEELVRFLQGQYRIFSEDRDFWKQQGKELGIEEVVSLIKSL